MTNKMQLCRIIYCSLTALCVSSDIFAHYQEHLNCITASGIILMCRCQLILRLIYTGCLRRKGQNFGRVFLMLKYTDITQNTYI